MSDPAYDELLRRWVDGEAGPDDVRALEAALAQPEHRRALVEAVMVDVHLRAEMAATFVSRKPRRIWERAAAALVVGLSAAAVLLVLARPEMRRVAIDGPASIELRGGRAQYGPGSAGSVEAGVPRLDRGVAQFGGTVRVWTPLGTIASRDAEFQAELGPGGRSPRVTWLIVSVLAGTVEVEADGRRREVQASETGVFGPGADASRYSQLLSGAKLSMAEAIARADAARGVEPGVLVSAELESEQGRVVYGVSFAQGRKELEIFVDAQTGEIVHREVEDEDEDPSTSGVTLLQAIDQALRRIPGTVVAAELDNNKFEVRIVADGVVKVIGLDAATGEVRKIR